MAQAEYDAADALLEIVPTTVAGVAALLRYAFEFEKAHPDEWCNPGLAIGAALGKTVRKLTASFERRKQTH